MITETEILDDWPSRSRTERYPWDAWFDGQRRVLVHGTHFGIAPASMRSTIYQAAKRRKPEEKIRVCSLSADDLDKYGDDCKRVALQVTVNGEWKRSARLTGAVA